MMSDVAEWRAVSSIPNLSIRLSPSHTANGQLAYEALGPRDLPPDSAVGTLSSEICCMEQDDDRLILGTKEGRLIQLQFRRGL